MQFIKVIFCSSIPKMRIELGSTKANILMLQKWGDNFKYPPTTTC